MGADGQELKGVTPAEVQLIVRNPSGDSSKDVSLSVKSDCTLGSLREQLRDLHPTRPAVESQTVRVARRSHILEAAFACSQRTLAVPSSFMTTAATPLLTVTLMCSSSMLGGFSETTS